MVSVAGISERLKTCWEPNLSLCLRRSDAISCIATCQKTSVINSKVIWSLSNAFMASLGQMSHLGLGSPFPNHGFEWHCLCQPWENHQEEFRRTLGCFDRTPFRHQLPGLCSQWRPPHWIQVTSLANLKLIVKTFLKTILRSTDSKTTIFCSDQHVQIWNLCGVDSTSKLSDPRTLHCHKYGINHVQVSPMGTMFATGSTDGTTSLWDLKVSQDSSIFVQFLG